MGDFAGILKDKLSSMSDEEFNQWWCNIVDQRTEDDSITAADYQSVIDDYIEGNKLINF